MILSGSLAEKGWQIVTSDYTQLLNNVRDNFLKEIRRLDLQFANIEDLICNIDKVSDSDVNSLRSIELYGFPELMAESFKTEIGNIAGNEIFLQRKPHININIPASEGSVTLSHTELLSGHSPYTCVLWVPLHDVNDDTGLFCMDEPQSQKFMEDQKDFRIPYDQEGLWGKTVDPLKVKYGEGIIFDAFVLHGAWPNKTKRARVSLDIRFQSDQKPLYEKGMEYFSHHIFGQGGDLS
jgi:sporadic carbohydrate cluster 2OG-Fe(II) oxygenase